MIRLKNLLQEAHRRPMLNEDALGDFMTLRRELKDFAAQDRFAIHKLDPSSPDYDPVVDRQVKSAIEQVHQSLNKLESLIARYK